MRLALISLDQRWHDKDGNFRRCTELVREAQMHKCELAVFPEMTLTSYSIDMAAIAEPETGGTLARFGDLAKETGVTIAFGACLISPVSGRPRNHFCLARPDGTSEPIYAKIHPFSFAGEDAVLEAGERIQTAMVGPLTFGASICYDLRFPELYAATAPECNAAVVIANWPKTRVAHWRTLLMARAIENQMYVFGVNRIGADGAGLEYEASTLAIGPDGTLLSPMFRGPELELYDIDPEEVVRYRGQFPTVRDKRYSLYSQFFRERAC